VKLDRALQHEILEKLAKRYPQRLDVQSWNREESRLIPNMHYLQGHGLIEGSTTREIAGDNHFINAQITVRGLDFLADDGGLTAILGVVTVKLHDETIRDLVASRIQRSDLPPEEKTGLLAQLRELRGESIKHLTLKLLDKGAESLPAILDAIRTSLPGG